MENKLIGGHTEIVSEEKIQETKERMLSKSIDIMDIDDLQKQIIDNSQNRDAIIDQSFDKFLNILHDLEQINEEKLSKLVSIICKGRFFADLLNEEAEIPRLDFYKKLLEKLQNKTLDKEEWLRFLSWHKEHLIKLDKFLKEDFEALAHNFVKDFEEKINPLLSYKVSIEEIKKVLENSTICAQDLLDSTSDGWHHFTGIISINISNLMGKSEVEGEEPQFQLEQVFSHEALHAITAGQTIARVKFDRIEEDDTERVLHFVAEQNAEWAGLSFREFSGVKFTWINEAITETLTSIITGSESIAYLEEIELFKLICQKGNINPSLFYDAYFEKKGKLRDKTIGENFFKKLIIELDKKFPMGAKKFFVHVDDLVRDEGVEVAFIFVQQFEIQKLKTISND